MFLFKTQISNQVDYLKTKMFEFRVANEMKTFE